MLKGSGTGVFDCNDSGVYFVSHTGNRIAWLGARMDAGASRATFLHIAFGTASRDVTPGNNMPVFDVWWTDLDPLMLRGWGGHGTIRVAFDPAFGRIARVPCAEDVSAAPFGGKNWVRRSNARTFPCDDPLVAQISRLIANVPAEILPQNRWDGGFAPGTYRNERDNGVYVLATPEFCGCHRVMWLGLRADGAGFWHVACSRGEVHGSAQLQPLPMDFLDIPCGTHIIAGVVVLQATGFRKLAIRRDLMCSPFGGETWLALPSACIARIEEARRFVCEALGPRAFTSLNPALDRCYCRNCRGSADMFPKGANRTRAVLRPPHDCVGLGLWPVFNIDTAARTTAYHGACSAVVARSILAHGTLILPGDVLEDGSRLSVNMGQIAANGKPSSYVTPWPGLFLLSHLPQLTLLLQSWPETTPTLRAGSNGTERGRTLSSRCLWWRALL